MISPIDVKHIRSKGHGIELTSDVRLPSTPARETSEFFDRINTLDPIKFSPPSTSENNGYRIMPSETRLTYGSVANLNPWHDDDRYTKIGDFLDYEDLKTPRGGDIPPMLPRRSYKNMPAMPHSQSENNIAFRSGLSNSSTSSKCSHVDLAPKDDHVRFSEETTFPHSLSRGRSIRCTPSPTKELGDIREDQSPVTPSPPKRSRSPMKRMFGEGGWLGKSMSMNELPSEEYHKTGLKQWGVKIKKGVETLQTESASKSIPKPISLGGSPSKSPPKSKFHVSLSPPMQAKLYSEIELMICATANQYLNTQAQQNRMSVESLQKVTSYWTSKNRPQVMEFMFDQATQRDLVLHNIRTFRFYGPNAENLMSMNSMMQAWKSLAREMAVRTFCTPDAVIRKHMHDTYKILEMLGAPLVTFLAFQEIQVKALKIIREEQERKNGSVTLRSGMERQWEPPVRSPRLVKRLEMENPFA
ncbi:MAG: hypothetical protein Q9217_003012 [Psora testacea]